MVNKISVEEFNQVEASKIALIDFSATWCGPCRMVGPVVDQLSNEMKDVEFFNVDVDDDPELAEKFGIQSIPALILLKDGKEVSRSVGFKPKAMLESWINSNK